LKSGSRELEASDAVDVLLVGVTVVRVAVDVFHIVVTVDHRPDTLGVTTSPFNTSDADVRTPLSGVAITTCSFDSSGSSNGTSGDSGGSEESFEVEHFGWFEKFVCRREAEPLTPLLLVLHERG
jgi:hypothetical protein